MDVQISCCPTCRAEVLGLVQPVTITEQEEVMESDEEKELDDMIDLSMDSIHVRPFIGPLLPEGERAPPTDLSPKKKSRIQSVEMNERADDEDIVRSIFRFVPADKVWDAHKWLKSLTKEERESYLGHLESSNRSVERMVFETLKLVKPLTCAEDSC